MTVETLRDICLAFPGVKEDLKWEKDLAFTIGDKMFAVTSFEEPFACSFKVPDEQFEELSVREGFAPAPYLARSKWVLVSGEARLSKKEWHDFLRQSYDLILLKLKKNNEAC